MSDEAIDALSNSPALAPQADIGDVAHRLRLAVTRTARNLRIEAGSGLTPTTLSALASIQRNGSLTPARLAEVEGVKRPTISRIANHLIDAGVIERVPDPEDGRSFRLSVTQQGHEHLSDLRSRKSAYLATQLSGLTVDELAVLSKAADILEQLNQDRCRVASASRAGTGSC